MSKQLKSPQANVVESLKIASVALDEMADAYNKLEAREKRVQTLVTQLIRLAQGATDPSPALLKVQMAMQGENQVFTSVSNVLKTRHDTVKNSISNIR